MPTSVGGALASDIFNIVVKVVQQELLNIPQVQQVMALADSVQQIVPKITALPDTLDAGKDTVVQTVTTALTSNINDTFVPQVKDILENKISEEFTNRIETISQVPAFQQQMQAQITDIVTGIVNDRVDAINAQLDAIQASVDAATSGQGSSNTGSTNTGSANTGSANTGSANTGSTNTGSANTGSTNTGSANTGSTNTSPPASNSEWWGGRRRKRTASFRRPRPRRHRQTHKKSRY